MERIGILKVDRLLVKTLSDGLRVGRISFILVTLLVFSGSPSLKVE